MKKNLLQKAVICLLFIGSTLNISFAQDDYQWDTHGIGFKAKSDMRIITNKADEFEAANDQIQLDIFPWQDANINKDDLADGIIEIAKDLKFDNIHGADALEIDDFQGYYVEGTKDGVEALILILLDKESSTNLVATIVYQNGSQADAYKIAESFYAYDK